MIRRALADDAAAFASAHQAAITIAYRGLFPPTSPVPTLATLRDEWTLALAEQHAEVLALEVDGAVAGVVIARPDPDYAGFGQLRRLHVHPDHWRRGFGSLLHEAALSVLRRQAFDRAGLWVLEGNNVARTMYERRGWSLVPGVVKTLDQGMREVRYERVIRR
jgi:GNAT superfamily N-acetyltransferase